MEWKSASLGESQEEGRVGGVGGCGELSGRQGFGKNADLSKSYGTKAEAAVELIDGRIRQEEGQREVMITRREQSRVYRF